MIDGLSERRRFPRLGKIRLGVMVEGREPGITIPKAVDYFVCPDEVKKIYGEKPKEINVMFPTEDVEKITSQWFRCYSKSRGLVCKGNGKTAVRLTDVKTGGIARYESRDVEHRDIICCPEECEEYKQKLCNATMFLQFMIPDVEGLGIWQIDTRGINSMVNINSSLAIIKTICGRISMVPLTLSLERQEKQESGVKRIIYALQLKTSMKLTDLSRYAFELPNATSDIEVPPPVDLLPEEVCHFSDMDDTEEGTSEDEGTEPQESVQTENKNAETLVLEPQEVDEGVKEQAKNKKKSAKPSQSKELNKLKAAFAIKWGDLKNYNIWSNEEAETKRVEFLKSNFDVESVTDLTGEQLHSAIAKADVELTLCMATADEEKGSDTHSNEQEEGTSDEEFEKLKSASKKQEAKIEEPMTQSEKREIVDRFYKLGYDNDGIKKELAEITGKEKGWSHSDVETVNIWLSEREREKETPNESDVDKAAKELLGE